MSHHQYVVYEYFISDLMQAETALRPLILHQEYLEFDKEFDAVD